MSSRPNRHACVLQAHRIVIIALALLSVLPLAARAALEVVAVPFRASDPTIPHPAYNGHPTRFKAIARGAACTNVYFRWDVNGDGVWDPLIGRTYAVGNWYLGDVHDLSGDAFLPYVAQTENPRRNFAASIEATCSVDAAGNPIGETAWATYRVMVYVDVPGTYRTQVASSKQLAVMRDVAVDDALWWMHTRLVRSGSGTSAITGYVNGGGGTVTIASTSLLAIAMIENGHLGAYPAGTYQGFGQPGPPGFEAANDQRWQADPYAEDVIRALNYLLAQAQEYSVTAADEQDDGTTPIPGTNDLIGISIGPPQDLEVNSSSLPLMALAMSGLGGTVAQPAGLLQGRALEFAAQQMVDYAIAAQIDEGSVPEAIGGWYYFPMQSAASSGAYAISYMLGGRVMSLACVERYLGGAGVHVNQRCRNRVANAIWYNPHTDGGSRYDNSGGASLFETTGGMAAACRWLGWDTWNSTDATPAGYPFLSITRGQARQRYDRFVAYLVSRWNLPGGAMAADPDIHLWKTGHYWLGADTCAAWTPNLWTYSAWGVRNAALLPTASSTLTSFGMNDWQRQFAAGVVEYQHHQGSGCPPFDRYDYEAEPGRGMVNAELGVDGASGFAVLSCSDANRRSPPVAVLDAEPVNVAAEIESVTFGFSRSFDLDGPIGSCILNAGDGSPPMSYPHEAEVSHTYHAAGTFIAQLTVTDTDGESDQTFRFITVHMPLGVEPQAAPPGARIIAIAPNPGRGAGAISYALPSRGHVRLSLYDLAGRQVATLVDREEAAGDHLATWDHDNLSLAPGVYLAELRHRGVVSRSRFVNLR